VEIDDGREDESSKSPKCQLIPEPSYIVAVVVIVGISDSQVSMKPENPSVNFLSRSVSPESWYREAEVTRRHAQVRTRNHLVKEMLKLPELFLIISVS